jgi:hypothetical protein
MTISNIYNAMDIWAEVEIRCSGKVLYNGKCAHIPQELRDFEVIYIGADVEAFVPILKIKIKSGE